MAPTRYDKNGPLDVTGPANLGNVPVRELVGVEHSPQLIDPAGTHGDGDHAHDPFARTKDDAGAAVDLGGLDGEEKLL